MSTRPLSNRRPILSLPTSLQLRPRRPSSTAGAVAGLAALVLLAACAGQQGQTSAPDTAAATLPKNTLPPAASTPAPQPPPQPPADDGIRVGFLAPLSGPQQPVGTALLNAAQMALFDQPQAKLVLLPRDTRGTPDGASAAANSAAVNGAALLVGPLFAESTRAATPVARGRNLNVISFSSDAQVAGNGVYILGFTPGQQADRITRYAAQSGLKRLALLVPDNAYGQRVEQAAQIAAGQAGAEIVQVERFRPQGEDYLTAVAALTGMPAAAPAVTPASAGTAAPAAAGAGIEFDAILVADGGDRLRLIAQRLSAGGLDPAAVRLLGTGLWDTPETQREPALQGGWFATAPPDLAADFERRYREIYGETPPKIAVLAYDAVALAASLSQRPPAVAGDRFSRLALEDPEGYIGYGGIFRLSPNGSAERGLAVLEVRPGGFVTVEPPPDRFEPPRSF